MKIRPLYIYIALLFIVCAVTILFISRSASTSSNSGKNGIPLEDINNADKVNISEKASQRLAELKKTIDNNPQDTLKMREYANLLGGAHHDQEAAKVFENILVIDPKRIDVMLVLTYIYFTLGNTGKAEEYTNRVLTINKDNPEANYNLGIIELKKGNKAKAKQILNSVIKRFPENIVAGLAKTSLQKL